MSSQCYSQYWHSIPVNTDSSLLWGSITNTIHTWRDPRYKWETDHINVVDQRASILELNILFNKHYSRISVMCNNVTVISWFNNVGDKESASCMKIVRNICDFCITKKLWISAVHIPSVSSNVRPNSTQKQPSSSVPRKRCSGNMQQIYRRTTMLKCDFNKVVLQLYWNHTSAWVFYCKFAAYFHNIFY